MCDSVVPREQVGLATDFTDHAEQLKQKPAQTHIRRSRPDGTARIGQSLVETSSPEIFFGGHVHLWAASCSSQCWL